MTEQERRLEKRRRRALRIVERRGLLIAIHERLTSIGSDPGPAEFEAFGRWLWSVGDEVRRLAVQAPTNPNLSRTPEQNSRYGKRGNEVLWGTAEEKRARYLKALSQVTPGHEYRVRDFAALAGITYATALNALVMLQKEALIEDLQRGSRGRGGAGTFRRASLEKRKPRSKP